MLLGPPCIIQDYYIFLGTHRGCILDSLVRASSEIVIPEIRSYPGVLQGCCTLISCLNLHITTMDYSHISQIEHTHFSNQAVGLKLLLGVKVMSIAQNNFPGTLDPR